MSKRITALLCCLIIASSMILVSCGSGGGGDNSFIFPFEKPDKSEEEKSKAEASTVISEEISENAEESSADVEESSEDIEESSEDIEESSEEIIAPGETYEFYGTSVVLPEGFTVSKTEDGLIFASPADYPVHSDNLVITYEAGTKTSYFTKNNYLELIKSSDGDVFKGLEDFDEFSRINIDGHGALLVRYSVEYYGYNVVQMQCLIDVSSGVVMYSYTGNSKEYIAAFEASLASISVTEEEGNDPVEAGTTYEYHGTSIVLPKGFTTEIRDDGVISAKPAEYPVHTDNIAITFANGGKISQYSEQVYIAALRTASPEMFGDLKKFDEFKNITIDGHKALLIRYSVNYSGIYMKFIQCIVEVSTGTVVYTFTAHDYYEEAFEKSLESIKVTE